MKNLDQHLRVYITIFAYIDCWFNYEPYYCQYVQVLFSVGVGSVVVFDLMPDFSIELLDYIFSAKNLDVISTCSQE